MFCIVDPHRRHGCRCLEDRSLQRRANRYPTILGKSHNLGPKCNDCTICFFSCIFLWCDPNRQCQFEDQCWKGWWGEGVWEGRACCLLPCWKSRPGAQRNRWTGTRRPIIETTSLTPFLASLPQAPCPGVLISLN